MSVMTFPTCLSSIIISTYSRIEHLHHFLGRTANGSLPNLDTVFVAWVSGEEAVPSVQASLEVAELTAFTLLIQGLGAVDPPEWLDLKAYQVPIYLESARVNSLTERFRKPEKMRTEAGLWIDDDLQFHPDDIELGFRSYRQFGSLRHQITGYSGGCHYEIRISGLVLQEGKTKDIQYLWVPHSMAILYHGRKTRISWHPNHRKVLNGRFPVHQSFQTLFP